MDIIDKLLDLQKQATLERSHYYVAACITEAIQEIQSLRVRNATQQAIESDAEKPCCGVFSKTHPAYSYCGHCGGKIRTA